MMANQLALLGLANVPSSHDPGQGVFPYRLHFPGGPGTLGATATASAGDAAPRRCTDAAIPEWDVLRLLARTRRNWARASNVAVAQLQIVAFNDTNDLLTWHVPNWYDQRADGCDGDAPGARVGVVNVFLTTSPPLLILENPVAAHDDYFRSASVWQAIRCGGTRGRIDAC